MKHGELFASSEYPPGRCVSCDAPLGRRSNQHGAGKGAPRATMCGARECARTYFQLRRARIDELVRLGLEAERRGFVA